MSREAIAFIPCRAERDSRHPSPAETTPAVETRRYAANELPGHAEAMETVEQIAKGVASLCREGRFLDAVERYYSPSIVSIEAVDFGLGREQRGIDAIRQKHAFWDEHNETHGVIVRGPYLGTGPAANQFALHFVFDITRKATAVRSPLSEIALYTVLDGKIAHEEFFYPSA